MSLPSAQLRGGSLRTSCQTSFWFQGVVGLAGTGPGGWLGVGGRAWSWLPTPGAALHFLPGLLTPTSQGHGAGTEVASDNPMRSQGSSHHCHHHCRLLGVLCIRGCVSRGLRSLASRSAASAKAEDVQLGSAARSYVAATQLRCNGLRIPDLQLSITFLGRVH